MREVARRVVLTSHTIFCLFILYCIRHKTKSILNCALRQSNSSIIEKKPHEIWSECGSKSDKIALKLFYGAVNVDRFTVETPAIYRRIQKKNWNRNSKKENQSRKWNAFSLNWPKMNHASKNGEKNVVVQSVLDEFRFVWTQLNWMSSADTISITACDRQMISHDDLHVFVNVLF